MNFGAGPLTFAVGDYVVYSGTIWQRSSGAVGTVTSVAATITGDAIGITGSPVTTSGTLAFAFGGNSTQYINGAGNLITFPSIISQAANLVTEVYNKTGATLTKGTIVYINGGQGNLPTITKAIATGDSTSAQTFGIVQANITNNNNGYVVVAGRISDLDTQAYTEGTQLYLSATTAGTWTSTKQYAPNHLVYVGIVVRAHPTQGVVEVKIQNGYELDELHNVAAQTPSNNDGLFYESSTDLWKNKSIATILGYTPQAQLNGTGFVKASGTTISYDNSTYVTTDTFQNISASKTFAVGFNIASAGGTNQITNFANTNSLFSGSAGSNVFGFNSANNIYFGKGLDNGGVLSWNNSAVRYYTLPDATGTIALVGGSGVGTVTSVAALTLGTSGTDLSSTVANGTTTPVITLNVPTASATNRGALSSTDWTTFNNKQSALTNPVTGTGTTNYLPKFTGTSTIGDSSIYDNGTNVGIGTATPYSATNYKFLTIDGTNGSGFVTRVSFINSFLAYSNSGGTTLSEQRALPIVFETTGTSRMTLNASGNLSVGNTNDTYKLDVSGTGRFTGKLTISNTSDAYAEMTTSAVDGDALFGFSNTGDGNSSWGIGRRNTGEFWIANYTGNFLSGTRTVPFQIASTGAATFSSTITATSGVLKNSSASPTYLTLDGTNRTSGRNYEIGTGYAGVGNDRFYIYDNTANSSRLVIDASGNFGIGTTSPTSKLHIVGLPTSSSGLTAGAIWIDGTTLKIVT